MLKDLSQNWQSPPPMPEACRDIQVETLRLRLGVLQPLFLVSPLQAISQLQFYALIQAEAPKGSRTHAYEVTLGSPGLGLIS